MLMAVSVAHAQVSSFKAIRETKGAVTHDSKGMYVWGAWNPSTAFFTIDMKQQAVFMEQQGAKGVEKSKFELFERPQRWIIKKNYKYLNFECMDSSTLEKVYLRLCEYDSGQFKITLMTPRNAVRYQVMYLKDGIPSTSSAVDNFDDVVDE